MVNVCILQYTLITCIICLSFRFAVSYIFGAFVAKLLFPVLGKYNTCVNIGIFVFLSILYWCFQHPRKVKHWLNTIGIKKED